MTITIKLDDIEAEVIRKTNKHIYLKVCFPDGKIKISAPLHMHLSKINKFALSKIDWIKKQQNKIYNKVKLIPDQYTNNETHFYRGKSYPLKIIDNNKFSFAELRNQEILLNIHDKANVEEKKLVLNEWYRKQLNLLIKPLIKKWERTLNVSVEKFYIRNMKTRWGSCTPKSRRIRFNLELAKTSPESLEYIVVHELVHLREASHNRKFKAMMDKFYPNWKIQRKELKNLNIKT